MALAEVVMRSLSSCLPKEGEMDIDALTALSANTVVATAVTDAISGTILGGPVLMGRDFGDVAIGSPENQPGG